MNRGSPLRSRTGRKSTARQDLPFDAGQQCASTLRATFFAAVADCCFRIRLDSCKNPVPMSSPRMHFRQGDHVCALYATREEQMEAAIDYIRGGLSRSERCLYIVCEHTPEEFRAGLRAAGIEVDREEARGALILLTKEDGYLKGEAFDPEDMIAQLQDAVRLALEAGFTGLCAAGDMSWLLDEPDGCERLYEYEHILNDFYPSHRALGLCLYNRTKLPAGLLIDGVATHPYVRIADNVLLENPFYLSKDPAAKQAALRDPGERTLGLVKPVFEVPA